MAAEIGSASTFVREVLRAMAAVREEFELQVVATDEAGVERRVTLQNSVATIEVIHEIGSPPCLVLSAVGQTESFALDLLLESKNVERRRPERRGLDSRAAAESTRMRRVLEGYGIAEAFSRSPTVFMEDDLVPRLREDARLLREHCADFLRGDVHSPQELRGTVPARGLGRARRNAARKGGARSATERSEGPGPPVEASLGEGSKEQ